MLQSDYESDFADDDTDKFCFYTEMSNFKIQVTKIFKDKTIILIKFLITCHLFLYFRNSICDGDIHLLALGLLCWLRHKRICLQCRRSSRPRDEPKSPALQVDSLPPSHQASPLSLILYLNRNFTYLESKICSWAYILTLCFYSTQKDDKF